MTLTGDLYRLLALTREQEMTSVRTTRAIEISAERDVLIKRLHAALSVVDQTDRIIKAQEGPTDDLPAVGIDTRAAALVRTNVATRTVALQRLATISPIDPMRATFDAVVTQTTTTLADLARQGYHPED